MKKVLFANPMVATTGSVLTDFVSNKKSRQQIEDAEKHHRDYDWAMQCERREGEAAGEARGKAEGRAEGIAEGEAKGKAETILTVLKARFKTEVPKRIVEELNKQTDDMAMQSLAASAAVCGSIEEFEAELR